MAVKYTKSSPKGVDVSIQELQTWLNTKLDDVWEVSDANYAAYGRAYKNKRNGGTIPEVYTGSDYIDVLADDTYDAVSFFYVDDNITHENRMYTATVHFVVFVKLSAAFSSVTHRADEEVHQAIAALLETEPFGFRMIDYDTGIDAVYSDFDYDDQPRVDMQPYHVVRYNCEVKYDMQPNSC